MLFVIWFWKFAVSYITREMGFVCVHLPHFSLCLSFWLLFVLPFLPIFLSTELCASVRVCVFQFISVLLLLLFLFPVSFKIHLLYFGALHLTIDGRSSDIWNFHTIHAFFGLVYFFVQSTKISLRGSLCVPRALKRSFSLNTCIVHCYMCTNADNFCIYPPF